MKVASVSDTPIVLKLINDILPARPNHVTGVSVKIGSLLVYFPCGNKFLHDSIIYANGSWEPFEFTVLQQRCCQTSKRKCVIEKIIIVII
jgi:hypothetical protein